MPPATIPRRNAGWGDSRVMFGSAVPLSVRHIASSDVEQTAEPTRVTHPALRKVSLTCVECIAGQRGVYRTCFKTQRHPHLPSGRLMPPSLQQGTGDGRCSTTASIEFDVILMTARETSTVFFPHRIPFSLPLCLLFLLPFPLSAVPRGYLVITYRWREWRFWKSSGGRLDDCCKTSPTRTNGVLWYSAFEN